MHLVLLFTLFSIHLYHCFERNSPIFEFGASLPRMAVTDRTGESEVREELLYWRERMSQTCYCCYVLPWQQHSWAGVKCLPLFIQLANVNL